MLSWLRWETWPKLVGRLLGEKSVPSRCSAGVTCEGGKSLTPECNETLRLVFSGETFGGIFGLEYCCDSGCVVGGNDGSGAVCRGACGSAWGGTWGVSCREPCGTPCGALCGPLEPDLPRPLNMDDNLGRDDLSSFLLLLGADGEGLYSELCIAWCANICCSSY